MTLEKSLQGFVLGTLLLLLSLVLAGRLVANDSSPRSVVPEPVNQPESTVPRASGELGRARYAHNWDDNPVVYIPEATPLDAALLPNSVATVAIARQYPHDWDDNPVAYLPEATVIASPLWPAMVPFIDDLQQYMQR